MTDKQRNEQADEADEVQTRVPAPDRDANGNPINPDGTPASDEQR